MGEWRRSVRFTDVCAKLRVVCKGPVQLRPVAVRVHARNLERLRLWVIGRKGVHVSKSTASNIEH